MWDSKTAFTLLPGIVVLNYNYFPETSNSPAKVGATAFAMSAVTVLEKLNLFRGVILYKRVAGITQPSITTEVRNSILCATISFNFDMEVKLLKSAINSAAEIFAWEDTCPPMLYYQTDTLLTYHPEHLPLCVTHHGPFHEDFARQFSDSSAGIAFGSQEKAQHLQIQQLAGINQLKTRCNAFVFQHSQIQGDYLKKCGVNPEKMFPLCPPIHSMRVVDYPKIIPKALKEALESPGVLLFTAVARLDYFKNVDLLVEASLLLLANGYLVTVLIAGDDEGDSDRRAKLFENIPIIYRRFFHVVPKLQKDTLYWLFEQSKQKGMFVCPSRYETLGITPLECGLRGVTTLISNSKQIEAGRFFPDQYCFNPTAIDLANAIKLFQKANLRESGSQLQEHLEERISEHRFRSDFLHAWRECSHWFEKSRNP